MSIIKRHLERIDTALNSSGRMKQFMEAFKIKDKTPTPPLANLRNFVIKKELINQPKVRRPISDFSY